MIPDLLRISPKTTILPVIHGSGDFALEVRRLMLDSSFDCVAVPLPDSFRRDVCRAIDFLPTPSIVVQREAGGFRNREWTSDAVDESLDDRRLSFVPVDPCQPVIAALRAASGEHVATRFIDLETEEYVPNEAVLPDAFAVKKVRVDRFAAAILPAIQPPSFDQLRKRIVHMAGRLRELESEFESILFVCSALEWPWVRASYNSGLVSDTEPDEVYDTELYAIRDPTHIFMMGELPFITGLYERARAELEDDENLSIDGIKELLIAARTAYRADFRGRARKITPQSLATCLRYIRNLTLQDRRFTPDLYTIVIAAKQVCGDGFARHVAETARYYPYLRAFGLSEAVMSVDRVRLPDDNIFDAVSRLGGNPVIWRTCELQSKPRPEDRDRWEMNWNPMGQCSWPPEDEKIEDFRARVFERARQIMGADLAKTEKFTTSIKDGIDIRDTLRNWHTGEIYVKELPPSVGNLDSAVMLFDSPADPRDYPWRTTWFAEHENESTLAFFGTDFCSEMVGPGIALATYGGAMFLFPPRPIPDIWNDPRLDFTETLEERLLAAACLHSESPHVALMSQLPPGAGWRRLAKKYKKKWVHIPLGQFSDSTIQQLRMVHVLNGRQV
ncbi:MAG: hypothetical protein KDB27_14485, partial [Planctomycetales bacterium]|nr:hypothetical protein [Planctomycetales bacterium]